MLTRHHHQVESPKDSTDPSSHVNFRFFSSPNKVGLMQRLSGLVCRTKQQLERLQTRIEEVSEQKRVAVDAAAHEDLKTIMRVNAKDLCSIHSPRHSSAFSGSSNRKQLLSRMPDRCGGTHSLSSGAYLVVLMRHSAIQVVSPFPPREHLGTIPIT